MGSTRFVRLASAPGILAKAPQAPCGTRRRPSIEVRASMRRRYFLALRGACLSACAAFAARGFGSSLLQVRSGVTMTRSTSSAITFAPAPRARSSPSVSKSAVRLARSARSNMTSWNGPGFIARASA